MRRGCHPRKASPTPLRLAPPGRTGREAVSQYGSEGTIKLPGTIILVGIFFTAFVLYYFVNWKYLSELWLFR